MGLLGRLRAFSHFVAYAFSFIDRVPHIEIDVGVDQKVHPHEHPHSSVALHDIAQRSDLVAFHHEALVNCDLLIFFLHEIGLWLVLASIQAYVSHKEQVLHIIEVKLRVMQIVATPQTLLLQLQALLA